MIDDLRASLHTIATQLNLTNAITTPNTDDLKSLLVLINYQIFMNFTDFKYV